MDIFMDSNRLEFVPRKMFRVFGIGIMQVDAPGSRSRSIRINYKVGYIHFGQDMVTQQTSRLALSGHIGYPFQPAVFVILFHGRVVFQKRPVGVDYQQSVIADAFKVINLIQEHTGFPGPLAHGYFLGIHFIKVDAIFEFRERTGLIFLD